MKPRSIVPQAVKGITCKWAKSGGGGNRTRVRGRTDRMSTSVVRASLSPAGTVPGRPPGGPAILESRASGDWLSLGAEPDRWRPVLSLGPS